MRRLPSLYRLGWPCLAATALLLAQAGSADARPVRPSFGCSMKQIQSPAAAQCINKAAADINSGKDTIHVVYCSSTGKMLCCVADGNNIVDQSCEIISEFKVNPNMSINPNGPGLQLQQSP